MHNAALRADCRYTSNTCDQPASCCNLSITGASNNVIHGLVDPINRHVIGSLLLLQYQASCSDAPYRYMLLSDAFYAAALLCNNVPPEMQWQTVCWLALVWQLCIHCFRRWLSSFSASAYPHPLSKWQRYDVQASLSRLAVKGASGDVIGKLQACWHGSGLCCFRA